MSTASEIGVSTRSGLGTMAAKPSTRSLVRRDLYAWLVPTVRIMLGLVLVINGVNWWVKLIDPYPSISDYAHKAPSMGIVGALIRSGILFHMVKATELIAGAALLSNRFVPLALVVALPVTLIVFVVDVFLSHHLRAHIMGSGTLVMSAFLMFAYLDYYWRMLTPRAALERGPAASETSNWRLAKALNPALSRPARQVLTVFGLVAGAIGLVMLVWIAVMIEAHLAGVLTGAPPPSVARA